MEKENAKVGIIYVDTNSRTAEKIGVGAIYFSKNKIRFKFSNSKILLVRQFIDANIWLFLKEQIAQIEERLKDVNHPTSNGIDADYFKYLNNYSQGLIKFGELKPFFGSVDEQKIATFLDNLVSVKRHEKIKEKIIPRELKVRIDENVIPDSLLSVSLDAAFEGNDKLLLFKEIKTSNKYQFKTQLQTQLSLSRTLSQLFNIEPERIEILVVTNKEHEAFTNSILRELNRKNIKALIGKEEFSQVIDSLVHKGYKTLSSNNLLAQKA